jgi:signal transduction histidine kinase
LAAEIRREVSMSATTADAESIRRPPHEMAPVVKGFVLGTLLLDIGILVYGAVVAGDPFLEAGWNLIPWVLVVAAVGFASVPFESGQQLGLDLPVLLSIGYLFGPIVAGATAFVAYVDARELHGEIPLIRALFNRAQTSLSVMAATAAFGAVSGASDRLWPMILAALLAVGLDCLVNYGTVVAVLCLHERISPAQGLSRLYFGSVTEFALTYATFGLLSLMLAEMYLDLGAWSLAVFVIPVILARQAFTGHQRLAHASHRADTQAEALRDMSAAMADERREERLSLAAGLHDEVLPPLYKVHLMGQVLRQDLSSGRLLALEEDLPELLAATESASEKMRALIRSLRESPISTGGLLEALRLLVEYLERESTTRITLQCGSVSGTPLVQLLAYQVVREALRNALRHAGASKIQVDVRDRDGNLRISVEDNGVGFDPDSVDARTHFGLALMRERVELAGGVVLIDSRRGVGSLIVARLPLTLAEG